VDKVCRTNADAVRLLVNYHLLSATAPDIEEWGIEPAWECAWRNPQLILKTPSDSLRLFRRRLTSSERQGAVIEFAMRLVVLCSAMAKPWSDCYSLSEPSTDCCQKH
jgi:hypothetical protein